jgi:hypothetical protein
VPEPEPNDYSNTPWPEYPLAPVGFSGDAFTGEGDDYDGDWFTRTFAQAGTLTITCREGTADIDVTTDEGQVLLERFRCGPTPISVEVPVAAGGVVEIVPYSDVADGIVKTYLVVAEFEPAP